MKPIYIVGEPIDITAEESFVVQISMTPEQHAVWRGFSKAPQPKKSWGDCQICGEWNMILAIQDAKVVCPCCWKIR